MNKISQNKTSKQKRQLRVRAKLRGTLERLRLTVYRSNKHIALQVINDETGKVLAASSDLKLKPEDKSQKTGDKSQKTEGTKTERAKQVAELLLAELKKKKIKKLCFDRGSYRYHGRVKAVAETLREGGIAV